MKWACKYDYQLASWIVYRGRYRLRDLFDEDSAKEEVAARNAESFHVKQPS